ncbi:hypothetical protein V8G54_024678, partial [Vigna mungo]
MWDPLVVHDGGRVGITLGGGDDGGAAESGNGKIESPDLCTGERVKENHGAGNREDKRPGGGEWGESEVKRRRRRGRLEGAALAWATRHVGKFRVCGKICLRLRAAEITRRRIIRSRGLLGGVEGSEPDACFLPGVSDLGGVAAPWSLPDPAVSDLFVQTGRIGP